MRNNNTNIQALPLITIVTVVYNGVDSILDTITSVSELSYPNLAYIVIDGGSNDGTVEIIKQHTNVVTYWESEPDGGIYDAMNKGWKKADSASFVLYLGSGDKIIRLPDMSQYSGADVVYGDVELGGKGIFRSSVGWRSFLGNTIHHQAMLVRKSLHPEPPFSLSFKIYADFDFNQRLMKSGVKFEKDSDFFAYALDGGVSAQITAKESLSVVRKNHGIFMSFLGSIYYKLQKMYAVRKNNSRSGSL